ncbi:hypothetical protein ACNFJ7_09850 [Sphingomonas sp. HT-1]|jgi:hypothetical protein|nr:MULTISPECIES: hypothetical protein [unclassified Sphingomonas]
MAVYRVIEADVVVNRIEWDGETPYDPGPGRQLAREDPDSVPPPQDPE